MAECSSLKAKVENTGWEGMPGIRFCAGGYEAFILPQLGANLIELKDTVRGLSLLRTLPGVEAFKARPHVYGIPVLFPPNRIEAGKFRAGGKEYNFPINDSSKENHIHGFVRHRPWEVTKMETVGEEVAEVEVTTLGDKNTEFYNYLPHEFEFKMLYRLSKEGLTQELSITNKSDDAMPMGLGFHTAFNVPFHPQSKGEDCRLIASIGEKWELNDQCMPTGKLLPLDEEEKKYRNEGILPLGKPMLDHYAGKPILLDGKEFNGAVMEDRSKKLRLIYETGADFKHWMIWNDAGNQGFVCPEPQTWAVNAPNLGLSDEVTGFKMIAPGATWKESCRIYIQEI